MGHYSTKDNTYTFHWTEVKVYNIAWDATGISGDISFIIICSQLSAMYDDNKFTIRINI